MRLFSKSELRSLSAILAFVILLGSAPLSVGVVIRSGPRHPEITGNICSPLQSSQAASNFVLVRPTFAEFETVLHDLGPIVGVFIARLIESNVAPDTPPPEAFA